MKNTMLEEIENRFESLQKVRNHVNSNDKELFKFLLEESLHKDEFKERFFIKTSGALIFKKDDFLTFLDLKTLNASYTTFINKIGLGDKFNHKKLLSKNTDIVLNFPFKDCVLKGAQKDDKDKNDELFFNEILAKDEIDVLLNPKALSGFLLCL